MDVPRGLQGGVLRDMPIVHMYVSEAGWLASCRMVECIMVAHTRFSSQMLRGLGDEGRLSPPPPLLLPPPALPHHCQSTSAICSKYHGVSYIRQV
jgi:hypothetical protein